MKPRKRYRARKAFGFADGARVARGTILSAPHVPVWVEDIFLRDRFVALHILGKVRCVSSSEVTEIKS